MICEFCEGQTIKKKVKKHHWLYGKLYIVKNIDAEVYVILYSEICIDVNM